MHRVGQILGIALGVLLGGAGCLVHLAISGFFIVVSVIVFFALWGFVVGGSGEEIDAEQYLAFVLGANVVQVENDRIQADAATLAMPLIASRQTGSDELQRLTEIYGGALFALKANRARAAQLDPEPVQNEVQQMLASVLDNDIRIYERLVDVMQEGYQATRRGADWTFPADPGVESAITRSDRLRAELNAAIDRVEREIETGE